MKKAIIVTLYSNTNYGNKLQNYAVYRLLKKYNIDAINLKNNRHLNYKRNIIISYAKFLLSRIKYLKIGYSEFGLFNYYKRMNKFKQFDSLIPSSKHYFNYSMVKKYEKYDYLFVGSDQVWNPKMALDDLTLFKYFNNKNKISISASIALNEIDEQTKIRFKNNLASFKNISLREESGMKMIVDCTERSDIELLVDPTMMIPQKEWDKLSNISTFNNIIPKDRNFILLYFFGEEFDKYKKEIKKFAEKQNLKIIDIYDKNDSWITSGPYDFLYLEKNAKLICTNSFHSAVFGIIFNTPILVFDRGTAKVNMNSRIDTLLNKFGLSDCKYNGTINAEILKTNFEYSNKILKQEQLKGDNYIKKALDL